MGESIGSILTSLGAGRAARSAPTASAAHDAPSDSFAARLDASFRARASQLGLDLPSLEPARESTAAQEETVDVIWQRAQLQSAALNGPGDAMMRAVGEAADARWEQRQRHAGRDPFDI